VFRNTVDLGATVVGGADRVSPQVAEIASQARYGEGSTPRSIGCSCGRCKDECVHDLKLATHNLESHGVLTSTRDGTGAAPQRHQSVMDILFEAVHCGRGMSFCSGRALDTE
jgi:hypothetical protein